MLLALAAISLMGVQSAVGVARASEKVLKHYCKQSQYCGEYNHYDWWEVNSPNAPAPRAAYDDPCEDGKKAYGLPEECNWTGKPFQYHNWTVGVVQLMPEGYNGIKREGEEEGDVNTLAIGIYKGEQGKRSQHELSVAGFSCRKKENCLPPYTWLQTSAPGSYTDNHIAVDMFYWDEECSDFFFTEEGGPCTTRRLWGFESE